MNRVASSHEQLHDLVAIGCGPFNLGLVALAAKLEALDLIAFEASSELRWHPGLMFDDATLQLSFLADLVSLVDPTHPLSFLAYLRDVDRMYAFYIRERFHPTRREYEDYLRWVAARLPALRFSHSVERVAWDGDRRCFRIEVARGDGSRLRVCAKDLAIGIGTEPATPASIANLPSQHWLHASCYLQRTRDLDAAPHVTVVGSGQSGAECFADLLRRNLAGGPALCWLTRTASFAPLDYSKLVLEMTTPAYVHYFHGLAPTARERLLAEQWQHYKGISTETLAEIHELLYQRELRRDLAPVELRFGVTVENAIERRDRVALLCRHRDTDSTFEQRTSLVVAATGYRERRPSFLGPLEPLLLRDTSGRYRVRLDHSIELADAVHGRIFVANADTHSHGVAAPDLGFCAYRNATILNTICAREVYRLPGRTAFTRFAPPPSAASAREVDAASEALDERAREWVKPL